MQNIDQRVLIQAPAQLVWDTVRDIARNPTWQVDCANVSFITPRREGPGVRWRYTTPTGHDCVIEATAWYNRIGYEYHFVDGMPFKDNFGRVRLQEIPEGTIVQWTFSYEPAGIFNGRRIGKQLELAIEENLQNLKKLFSPARGSSPARGFESKSLMQDAPDVESREHYKPRHPSQTTERPASPPIPPTVSPKRERVLVEPPIESGDLEPFTPIQMPAARMVEPPIQPSDTRPRPAVTLNPPAPRPDAARAESNRADSLRLNDAAVSPRLRLPEVSSEEPDFLAHYAAIRATEEREAMSMSIFEPPISQEDTKPTSAIKAIAETDIMPRVAAPPDSASILDTHVRTSARATEERPAVSLPVPSDIAERTTEQPRAVANFTPIQPPEIMDRDATPIFPKMQPTPAPANPASAPDTRTPIPTVNDGDTSTKSIWEIFGVQRPAETAAPETVTPPDSTPPSSAAPSAARSEVVVPASGDTTTYLILTGRMGLRARRRRDMARLRRPSP
jgi:uncharacterized protein YndB with AHSA1/START domain